MFVGLSIKNIDEFKIKQERVMAGNLHHIDDTNFKESIQNGITLVDFHATWCGPCRMIAPIVEHLAEALKGKIRVGKLDIDQAPGAASNLQITSVPTLILFKDGQELKRVVGVKDLEYLTNLVQSYL